MQHVIPISYVPAPSLCQILAHNFVPYKVHHGLVGSALVVSCSDRAWSRRSDAHPYPSWLHRSTRLLADSPWLVGGLSLHVRTPKLAYLQSSSASLRCRVLQPLELILVIRTLRRYRRINVCGCVLSWIDPICLCCRHLQFERLYRFAIRALLELALLLRCLSLFSKRSFARGGYLPGRRQPGLRKLLLQRKILVLNKCVLARVAQLVAEEILHQANLM